MIPQNITRANILRAIEEIKNSGYPEKNESRRYDLEYEDTRYPPKVVISVANKFANGKLLDFSEFSGGEQFANKFLVDLGFDIKLKNEPSTDFEFESFSWTIVSDTLAEKRMDRSSFKHHGTGIPVDIRKFFGIEAMKAGDRRDVTLTYGILNFPAHIEMVNEKNPRTRLLWRKDLQNIIQSKYPIWSKYFDTHKEPSDSAPVLKIRKTSLKDTYRIEFEETKRSSDSLVLQKVYSREELKEQFKITDASINNGIFKPKEYSSIWLFVTEEKTIDRTQYRDYFDGFVLHFEGQTKGITDHLIMNHRQDGNELLVFYRKKKNEFPKFGFKYLGRFNYYPHKLEHIEGQPTHFTLYPEEVTTDDEKGNLIISEPESDYLTEGKEKTRIQTYYERNPKLRAQAIKIHGTKCVVCGFDFEEKYGQLGAGYIEIHHLIPHASIKGEREVDPKKDLIPVCSNCHRMIHKPRGTWLKIEELKNRLL